MKFTKNIFIVLAILVSASIYAQKELKVEVWAAKLEVGEASPIFKVNNDDTSKKIGWKNRLFIQPEITFQTIEGIGGAFNEIGGEALLSLSKKKQKELINNLFSKKGAGFTFVEQQLVPVILVLMRTVIQKYPMITK